MCHVWVGLKAPINPETLSGFLNAKTVDWFDDLHVVGILCAGLMDSTWRAIVPFLRAVAFDSSLNVDDRRNLYQALLDKFVQVSNGIKNTYIISTKENQENLLKKRRDNWSKKIFVDERLLQLIQWTIQWAIIFILISCLVNNY